MNSEQQNFELKKIELAQNANIAVAQGNRLVKVMADFYTENKENNINDLDVHQRLIPGETYLFLLAAAQFSKLFTGAEIDPFVLKMEICKAIEMLRNAWEHRNEFNLLGENSFSGYHNQTREWLEANYKNEKAGPFKITYSPLGTTIGGIVSVEEVIREANEWYSLVYHV